MFFDLSKPQKLLQQSVREFCKREVPLSRVRSLMESETAMDDQLWSEFADQGWLGLHLPEEHGGLGLGLVDLVVVAEELGRACVPGPWLAANWAGTLVSKVGGPTAEELVSRFAQGEALLTVAAWEESADWDCCAESLETSLASDGLSISGRKDLVPHAQQAEQLVCVARQGDGVCLALIPNQAAGFSSLATPGIDATRRLYRCQFADVRIDVEQLLATGGQARAALLESLQVATVAVCGEMLGLLQWYLETSVEYSKTRKQFDRAIGSFQVVQHMCADLLLMAESARSAVWYAAWALQEGKSDAPRAVSIAKAYTSDVVRKCGNLTSQLHGGIGFTWEHDLHLYYKRAKADEYLFGDASFHREKVAAISFSVSGSGDTHAD